MGNSKSKEIDDSHYKIIVEYIKTENNNRFTIINNNSGSKETRCEGGICNISNKCGEYLSFYNKIDWKENFFQECKFISKNFEWGKTLPDLLYKFKGNNDEVYEMQINYIENFSKDLPFSNNKNENNFINDNFGRLKGKYTEDEDFMQASFSKKSLSLNTSFIAKDSSFNKMSASSEIFTIECPKTIFKYENNSFLVPNFMDNSDLLTIDYVFDNDIQRYKNITKIIEKHLNDEKNPLCYLKREYISYFIEKYEDYAYEEIYSKKEDFQLLALVKETMNKDIQQFVRIMKDCIIYFYKIDNLCNKNKKLRLYFTFDNIINFVLSVLFEDHLYSIVFEIHRKLDKNKELQLKNKLKLFKNKKPEYYGISDKYSLDSKTMNFFNKNIEMELDSAINFSKSIDCIKNLQFLKSPSHKLKAIVTSKETILDEISFFYNKIGIEFDRKISPDDIMPLYVYLIAKSAFPTICTHMQLIDNFLTENCLATMSGYFFATVSAALDYFINIKGDEIKESKK